MQYKLPSRTRRALEAGKLCGAPRGEAPYMEEMFRRGGGLLSVWGEDQDGIEGRPGEQDGILPTPVVNLYGTDHEKWCCAVREFQTVKDGMHVCVLCGLVRGNVYQEPPVWHGTHSIVRKAVYDFRKHVDRHLARISARVCTADLDRIRAVFPNIYKAFFVVAPKRRNFMSYGFVIKKLLLMLGRDVRGLDITVVKTPCKVRDCEKYWRGILERVDLGGIKARPPRVSL